MAEGRELRRCHRFHAAQHAFCIPSFHHFDRLAATGYGINSRGLNSGISVLGIHPVLELRRLNAPEIGLVPETETQ
jgi:hypothetical protein